MYVNFKIRNFPVNKEDKEPYTSIAFMSFMFVCIWFM